MNKNKQKPLVIKEAGNSLTFLENDDEKIFKNIERYLELCLEEVDSLIQQRKGQGFPRDNHLIPKFILDSFGIYSEKKDKSSLQVIRYRFDKYFNCKGNNIQYETSKSFSVRRDFYTSVMSYHHPKSVSEITEDAYYIERFLSVIERNSAPLLKFRQKDKSYGFKTRPYFYGNLEDDPGARFHEFFYHQEGQRIILAVFFASQILRSSFMVDEFMAKKSIRDNFLDGKGALIRNDDLLDDGIYPLSNFVDLKTYKDFFMGEIFQLTLNMYSRSWRWVYSKYDLVMPSGTAISPIIIEDLRPPQSGFNMYHALKHFDTRKDFWESDYLVMPISRYAAIYFLPHNSFRTEHDGVFKSNSILLNALTIQSIFKGVAADMYSSYKKGSKIRSTEICLHPNAFISHIYTNSGDEKLSLANLFKNDFESRKYISSDKDFIFLHPILRSGETSTPLRFSIKPQKLQPVLFSPEHWNNLILNVSYDLDLRLEGNGDFEFVDFPEYDSSISTKESNSRGTSLLRILQDRVASFISRRTNGSTQERIIS